MSIKSSYNLFVINCLPFIFNCLYKGRCTRPPTVYVSFPTWLSLPLLHFMSAFMIFVILVISRRHQFSDIHQDLQSINKSRFKRGNCRWERQWWTYCIKNGAKGQGRKEPLSVDKKSNTCHVSYQPKQFNAQLRTKTSPSLSIVEEMLNVLVLKVLKCKLGEAMLFGSNRK